MEIGDLDVSGGGGGKSVGRKAALYAGLRRKDWSSCKDLLMWMEVLTLLRVWSNLSTTSPRWERVRSSALLTCSKN